ncbi:MAG: tetratricopeptide repeat protein [Elusimicrobia bacterium]|nr:tetratricopeptide repeat protein [Elusimicrobiota bacterium]MBD3411792.1 tetratricopeptide repeat protein [Elusimicrobiota bacterium]
MSHITRKLQNQDLWNALIVGMFAVVLFLLPLVPDEKIIRLKLKWFEIGVFACCAVWLLSMCFTGRWSFRYAPLHGMIVLLITYLMGLYWIASNKPVAGVELRRALLCFGLYVIGSQVVVSLRAQRRVLWPWIIGACLGSWYGMLQFTGGIAMLQVPRMNRIMGMFGNPIFFAAHLIAAIPLCVSLMILSKKMTARIILGSIGASMVTALVLTQTRAAYVAAAVSLGIYLFVVDRYRGWPLMRGLKQQKYIFVISLIVLISMHGLLLRHSERYAAACQGLVQRTVNLVNRQQAHLLIWRDALALWKKQPIIGTGLGAFHIHFPEVASDELKQIWPQKNFIVNDAHNEYVQLLAETGIIGLGLFIGLLVVFFMSVVRAVRFFAHEKHQHAEPVMLVGIMAGVAAILIQNLFSVDMRFGVSSGMLFLFLGMGVSLNQQTIVFDVHDNRMYRVLIAGFVIAALGAVGYGLIKPYAVQYRLRQEPGFFEQKIADSQATLNRLVNQVHTNPHDPLGYEKLGWVYAKEKQWNEAIKNYTIATTLDPTRSGAFNNLGNIYFTLGDYDKAQHYYAKALAIDPTMIDAHMNLGISFFYQGKLAQAAQHINDVIAHDPDNAQAHDLLKRMKE